MAVIVVVVVVVEGVAVSSMRITAEGVRNWLGSIMLQCVGLIKMRAR